MSAEKNTRRNFLKALGLGAAAFALSNGKNIASVNAAGGPATLSGKKYNFVFILIDDLGWRDVGCYGNQYNETPNIDRLAAQGMRFTDAYAACPVCSPTRASILSGQYTPRVGITDFITGHWRPYEKLRVPINRTQYMPAEVVTIAEALKPAGYVTGLFGKWHLGGKGFLPKDQGFDESCVTYGRHFGFKSSPPVMRDKQQYLADFLTDRSEGFLEKHRDKAFCLFLHHYAVHIPLEAEKNLIEKYEKKPKPADGINNPVYAAMIEHVDNSVGRIMKKLDDLKLSDRTVVVFFSDNGGLRRHFKDIGPIVTTNAPLRDEKGTLYEGGIREPLIVRWPGVVQAESVCSVPVSSIDFYPTFLETAGTEGAPDHVLDGVSLMPLLRRSGGLKREALYWHYPHYHHSTPAGAIRQGKWKLIEFFEDGRLELYDLEKDIGEKVNLAPAMPEKAQALQKKLAQWRASIKADMPVKNPDHDPARAHEWGRHPSRG